MRFNWEQFKQWRKSKRQLLATLERKSGLIAYFDDEADFFQEVVPRGHAADIFKSVEFWTGLGVIAVDENAADKISKQKARGKLAEITMYRDNHGAIICQGTMSKLDEQRYNLEREKHAANSISGSQGPNDKVPVDTGSTS